MLSNGPPTRWAARENPSGPEDVPNPQQRPYFFLAAFFFPAFFFAGIVESPPPEFGFFGYPAVEPFPFPIRPWISPSKYVKSNGFLRYNSTLSRFASAFTSAVS